MTAEEEKSAFSGSGIFHTQQMEAGLAMAVPWWSQMKVTWSARAII